MKSDSSLAVRLISSRFIELNILEEVSFESFLVSILVQIRQTSSNAIPR